MISFPLYAGIVETECSNINIYTYLTFCEMNFNIENDY